MAAKFSYVNAFVCERVLIEKDEVLSAIRIADIFQVPENAPESTIVQFWLVLSLKINDESQSSEYRITCTLIRSSGDRAVVVPTQVITPARRIQDPSIPLSIGFVAQVNLKPVNMGAAYIEIDVDGEIVSVVPITLQRIPAMGPQK